MTHYGDDPAGYALSVNVNRRHLTQGQRAMAIARAVQVVPASIRQSAREHNVAHPRIAEAQTILEYAPQLAQPVADGDMPFARALERLHQVDTAWIEPMPPFTTPA